MLVRGQGLEEARKAVHQAHPEQEDLSASSAYRPLRTRDGQECEGEEGRERQRRGREIREKIKSSVILMPRPEDDG
jgi:hypothetical protein